MKQFTSHTNNNGLPPSPSYPPLGDGGGDGGNMSPSNNSPSYPPSGDGGEDGGKAPGKVTVPILTGAADILVTHRELRNKYCTNSSIKTWSIYFLLKAQGTSGIIKNWTAQKQQLLSFCKITENSFRARLADLKALGLATVSDNRTITLTSFIKAADILGITYEGITNIEYNYELPGQQIFQYFLRAEEIRTNQHKQLKALCYYASKNPLLKEQLLVILRDAGADVKKLQSNLTYFQMQLLKMQQQAFKEGSPLLDIIHALRADINRSVKTIRDHHTYKSAQSVSYMKRRMTQMEIITYEHICIESAERTRLYVSEAAGSTKPRRRDAYKYLPAKKVTAWFLTDQINFRYQSQQQDTKPNQKNEKKKAA